MTQKILIVGPSWVGDMVMAQALFMTLQVEARATGDDAIIDVLAPAWSRPLLERMPEVRRAIDLPFRHGELNLVGRYRLGHSLRNERYTQVIVLPNSFKSGLLARFVHSPRRTGWRGEARGILFNDVRTLDKAALPLMVQRFVALGLAPGASLPSPLLRPKLVTDPLAVAAALQAMNLHAQEAVDRPVLVICPGAEFGDAKQWPAEHYASLAQHKIQEGWQVWSMGSAKDGEVSAQIYARMDPNSQAYYHDLTGKTSLAQAIDLMSVARAVVSNDSGLMHVAAALARPIVALYGPTSADFTPPLADNVQLLAIDIACRPCFERTCPLKHKRCLVDLSPQLALTALERVLTGKQRIATTTDHSEHMIAATIAESIDPDAATPTGERD